LINNKINLLADVVDDHREDLDLYGNPMGDRNINNSNKTAYYKLILKNAKCRLN
jgi:hypothetical protein